MAPTPSYRLATPIFFMPGSSTSGIPISPTQHAPSGGFGAAAPATARRQRKGRNATQRGLLSQNASVRCAQSSLIRWAVALR